MNAAKAHADKTNLGFVTLVSIVAAVGGLLFGYDTSVISGAIGFMQNLFHLDNFMKGWAVSCLTVGAVIGAAFAGTLSDRYGRKKMLISAGVLFSIGSVGSALSGTISTFVWVRIVGGIGIGISSTLVPLYIAEIAPAAHRGRLVSLNQLAVVIGISAIYFVNRAVAGAGGQTWDINTGWRWMFGLGIVPGVIFILLLLNVPESPRWLVKQGKNERALNVLERINGSTQAKAELKEIHESIENESVSIATLFRQGLRIALIVGVVLGILQQVTGINAIMYYAPSIFQQTGAGTDAQLTETIIVGVVNLVFTIISLWLIDRLGRKLILLIGTAVMTVSLLIVGYEFYSGHTSSSLILVFILVFVAAFAISMGPVVWLIMSEIFPTRIRGRATAIASVALWAADYLVSQLFPMLLAGIGPAHTFWAFGAMSIIAFVFSLFVVPETKGRSLEEIERGWGGKPGGKPGLK
ncbi:sugar porter family MFS transporter [Alicyclobacillus ferrooxydans]|uniref:MFS transporter n=1 Tax=Alicyclobacillus ferrooxydans TaxID=471514 RepID=A0A0N8PP21_9BACL|nr:sugar porter family MFS transporter [Alicyclobacillus ferrooxydans]KPV43109.1 MFS transporter [Alicyclobacillus ferrooxydans]